MEANEPQKTTVPPSYLVIIIYFFPIGSSEWLSSCSGQPSEAKIPSSPHPPSLTCYGKVASRKTAPFTPAETPPESRFWDPMRGQKGVGTAFV